MDILLVRTKIISQRIACDYEGRFVPVGLLLVAAVLERAGHRVRVVDLSVDDMARLEQELAAFAPPLVGIGAMSVEYEGVLEVARKCKERLPACRVVVGGPIASANPQKLLESPVVDYAVLGEGEATIVELASCLENNRDVSPVPGIAFKRDGEIVVNKRRENIDLTEVPFPARHLINMERYISSYPERFQHQRVDDRPIRGTNLTVSRGCPYSCIYCDKNVFGNQWRVRRSEQVLDEIELLIQQYGINALMFDDDAFGLNKAWVRDFCAGVKQRGLNIVWHCNSRCNHADAELFRLMYEAGCRSIAFGIEYGNQEVLDRAQKKLSLEEIRRGVQMAKAAGFLVTGYFMLGMLDETKKTIMDTINLAISLPLDAGGFGITVPMPGTELFCLASERGLINNGNWGQWDRTRYRSNLTRDVSYEQLDKLLRLAGWKFFWSRPNRKTPKAFNRLVSGLFPLIYWGSGGDFQRAVSKINSIRRRLGIPLP
jgi:magnesium-protoporphyrin IX monomethyl ester (oxidative) cyclase